MRGRQGKKGYEKDRERRRCSGREKERGNKRKKERERECMRE